MTINDKIRDKNLQYYINWETVKIPALSSGKIDKYEYLAGEKIVPSDQIRIIEQVKFTYCRLGKSFENQIKTIEDQGKKQIKGLEYYGKQLVESSSKKESLRLLKQRESLKNLIMKE